MQVANRPVSELQRIASALTPIIGRLGVFALYRHSLHLAGADYPWLLDAKTSGPAVLDFDSLRNVLALRTATEAAASSQATLEKFVALLDSLIGPSLTERLLHPGGRAPHVQALGPQETDP